MNDDFSVTHHRFDHDPALERRVRELASFGTLTVQDIIDACQRDGFDGRAAITEIGMLLMSKTLRPAVPTDRVGGQTVVVLAKP